eukprot:2615905-Lingulodinium_polyedra.AAC.1
MMRTQGLDPLRPLGPPFQCSAPTLLYQADHAQPPQPWHSLPMDRIPAAIRAFMPADLHEGWRQLHRRDHGYTNDAARAALWVEDHGAALGFRPPTVEERSRVTGAGAYLAALGLGT